MRIACRLGEVKAEQGLSWNALSRVLGTTPAQVRKLASGDVVPSLDRARRYAGLLHVELESIWPPDPKPSAKEET